MKRALYEQLNVFLSPNMQQCPDSRTIPWTPNQINFKETIVFHRQTNKRIKMHSAAS